MRIASAPGWLGPQAHFLSPTSVGMGLNTSCGSRFLPQLDARGLAVSGPAYAEEHTYGSAYSGRIVWQETNSGVWLQRVVEPSREEGAKQKLQPGLQIEGKCHGTSQIRCALKTNEQFLSPETWRLQYRFFPIYQSLQ